MNDFSVPLRFTFKLSLIQIFTLIKVKFFSYTYKKQRDLRQSNITEKIEMVNNVLES